jgi:hypothetical protein
MLSIKALRIAPTVIPSADEIEDGGRGDDGSAELKALLRKAAEPTVDGLWDAIGHIIDS